MNSFTDDEIQYMLDNIDKFTAAEVQQIEAMADELVERKRTTAAHADVIAFTRYMTEATTSETYNVGKHHRVLSDLLMDVENGKKDRVCVNIAPRHGKLLADNTPVLTPGGWRTHGDLQPGDWVYHPSGEPVQVLAVSPKAPADMCVETSDGEQIQCHENHEWTIWSGSDRRWRTVPTSWFLERTRSGPTAGTLEAREEKDRYQLPPVAPRAGWQSSIARVYRNPIGVQGHCIQVDSPDGLYLAGRQLVPTHNSYLVSTMFPAWYLGRNPEAKVMLVSHTADLAVDFGRKVRNIIGSEAYQRVFPGVTLAKDSKSAGRWNTNHGGEFYATGVGSALAGRGAHLLLVDDPHSEQDILNGDYSAFDKAYEWFTTGARTRLMKGGSVAIVQTRWFMDDLTGRLTQDMAKDPMADQYEVVEFPALMSVMRDGKEVQKALWPEFFPVEALLRTKASMPAYQWNAQYQQQPTAEEASIVKREWWQKWPSDKPPECEYIIMSLDAAAETNNRADFTSLTTWGVFMHPETDTHNIILLNSIKKRMEFPDLKQLAVHEYAMWEPDSFIIEKKSAGTALYQELRYAGVPVTDFTPHRGSGDKTARLNSVADIFRSGLVWYPDTRWAEEVIEEVAGFPFMKHDDIVDTTIMALMRFRSGGFIRLPSDDVPLDLTGMSSRRRAYY